MSIAGEELLNLLRQDPGDENEGGGGGGEKRKTPAELASEALHRSHSAGGDGGGVMAVTSSLKRGVMECEESIRLIVAAHGPVLMSLARTSSGECEESLRVLKQGIAKINAVIRRVKRELAAPRDKVAQERVVLLNLQESVSLLRAAGRRMRLTGKLRELYESSKARGGGGGDEEDDENKTGNSTTKKSVSAVLLVELPKLAKLLHDIQCADETGRVEELEVVRAKAPFLDKVGKEVREAGKRQLHAGLEAMNQAEVASALQVFYNLGELENVLTEILKKSKMTIQSRIHTALNPDAALKAKGGRGGGEGGGGGGVGGGGGGGGSGGGGDNTVEKRQSAMWRGLASCLEEIMGDLLAVWHLQRVVWKKRDPITHARFVDSLPEGMRGEGSLSASVWNSMVGILKTSLAEEKSRSYVLNRSKNLKEALITGFSRLATLLELFVEKLKRETAMKSAPPLLPLNGHENLLESVNSLKKQYLSRTLSKLSETVNGIFKQAERGPIQVAECGRLGRILVEELRDVSSSSTLLNAQCRGIEKVLKLFTEKCDKATCEGPELSQVAAINTSGKANAMQIRNIALCNGCQELYSSLSPIIARLGTANRNAISGSLVSLKAVGIAATTPIVKALTRRLEDAVAFMHEEGATSIAPGINKQTVYISRLLKAMEHTRSEYLERFQPSPYAEVGETGEATLMSSMAMKMASRCMELFVRHLCLRGEKENGGGGGGGLKSRVAKDMTDFETGVGRYLVPVELLGKQYQALRALRPLLSIKPENVLETSHTKDIRPSLLLLLLLNRFSNEKNKGRISMPHKRKGMTLPQYAEWTDQSDDVEVWEGIRASLEEYKEGEEEGGGGGGDGGGGGSGNGERKEGIDEIYDILMELGKKLVEEEEEGKE